jgi:NADH-quinone oxidoreductase subunit J
LIAAIAFYLFATLTIASAVAVVFARNPVHSVKDLSQWIMRRLHNG